MKKSKTIYWIVTGLFLAFMILSAISEILFVPGEVTMITGLGFPKYFVPFLGVAKLLGIIAILLPGFKRIKEWAYAGLAFDLIGATYSMIAHDGFMPQMSFMLIPITFLFLSYYFYQKKTQIVA